LNADYFIKKFVGSSGRVPEHKTLSLNPRAGEKEKKRGKEGRKEGRRERERKEKKKEKEKMCVTILGKIIDLVVVFKRIFVF
jgi:hypothetical protein